MGKLRTFLGQEICKLLEQNGFQIVRTWGSHIVIQKRSEETTITVPIPNHKALEIGTLQSIIRQSQLPRSLFEV